MVCPLIEGPDASRDGVAIEASASKAKKRAHKVSAALKLG